MMRILIIVVKPCDSFFYSAHGIEHLKPPIVEPREDASQTLARVTLPISLDEVLITEISLSCEYKMLSP